MVSMAENDLNVGDLPEGTVEESTELYELTLEQVLQTPVTLDAATRQTVKIQDFLDDGKIELAVPVIASRNETNYTSVMATALIHGLSIFLHEHGDLITSLKDIREDALFQNYRVFSKMHQSYSANVKFGKLALWVHTDPTTHDQLVSHSKILKLTLGQLATACILLSFVECTLLPEYLHKECAEKAEYFNISCSLLLQNLNSLRY